MGDKMRELLTAKRRRGWYLALTLVLAVLVTAGVGGLFHQPAVAKTYQVTALTCTAEAPAGPGYAGYYVHTHNEDCFDGNGNLVCPLPEIKAHVHDETCYTTKAVQTCGLAESDGHQHTEACYTRVRGDLICEKSTDPVLDEAGNVLAEGHVHTDECFAWTEELTCGMEAGEGAHHHGESCFEYVTNLSCDKPEVILHAHSDDCYQKKEDGSIYVDEDGNTFLICGMTEVTEHVHGPECFTTYELDDEENPISFTTETAAEETDAASDAESTEGDESGLFFLFPEEDASEEEEQPAESANPETETGDTDVTDDGNADPAEGNTPDTDETVDTEETENTELTDGTEPNAEGENQEAASGETAPIAEEPHEVIYTGTRGAEKGGITVLAEIPEGALDENAQLVLADADESAARKQILQVVNENAAESEEREISSMLLLDIGFVIGGESAVLNGLDPIRVTIRAASIRTMSAPKLFHLSNGTAQEVKDVLFDAEAGTAVFTATSFSPFAVVDLTGEDPAEETAEETVSVSMPAQSFTGETESVVVSVEAPEGAFPEGTTMVVSPVEMDDDTLSNVTGAVESSGEKKVVTAQAVDISFFDADGTLIEPKLPIKVSMKSALVSESENVALVHLTEAAAAEPAENAEAEATEAPAAPTAEVVTDVQVVENPDEHNEIQFESDAFSVYVLVGTETITTNFITADGETYTITVTYGPEAGIPAGATLAVAEIPQDSEEYAAYLAQAQSAVKAGAAAGGTEAAAEPAEVTEEAAETPDEAEAPAGTESTVETESTGSTGGTTDRVTVTTARFFDITILDAEGNPVEPAAPVDVKIEYMEPAETAENYQVVHFGEETEVLNPAVSGTDGTASAFDFQASSFSVFGVVGTKLVTEYTLTTPDGEDITFVVTVTYTEDAQIPDGSSLSVTEMEEESQEFQNAWKAITGEDYFSVIPEESAELSSSEAEGIDTSAVEAGGLEAVRQIRVFPAGMSALDIAIYDKDGQIVEPMAAVDVSIVMKSIPEGVEKEELEATLEVQHLKETAEGTVAETLVKADTALGKVTVQEESVLAEFTTDSFSTYTITWGSTTNTTTNLRLRENNNNRAQITVYYVDQDGHPITSPTGINANTDQTISWSSNQYTYNITASNLAREISGYTYQGAHSGSYNGTEISSVTLTRTRGWGNSYNYSTDVNSIYLVYSGSAPGITVHYGYMSDGAFVEFTEDEDGDVPAGTTVPKPSRYGDQWDLEKTIPGYRYVTSRLIDPVNGREISPLLNTDPPYKANTNNTFENANSSAHPSYTSSTAPTSFVSEWRYRQLSSLDWNPTGESWSTANDGKYIAGPVTGNGVTKPVSFTETDKDIYVIYEKGSMSGGSGDGEAPDLGELNAPTTDKQVASNHDGTYDVTLSAKGEKKNSEASTKANVVVVLDTSWSMYEKDAGNGQSRFSVAKTAIGSLADKLFALNEEESDTIELAFVTFAQRVRNEEEMKTIYSGTNAFEFKNMINGLDCASGTNWDDALYAANHIYFNDNDPTYIVFVTDGDPISCAHPYGTYNDWDGGTYYNVRSNYEYALAAKNQADLIIANNKTLYTIGAFGEVKNLEAIGGTYLGQADNTTAINGYFDNIISDIQAAVGYKNITINDGITALSSTGLARGDISSLRYYRSGGKNSDGSEKYDHAENDGLGVEWVDAPAAYLLEVKSENDVTKYYKNGTAVDLNTLTDLTADQFLAKYPVGTRTVIWNINSGSEDLLEDGVTYTMIFTMWPSQEAYDLIADLNNGTINYDDLSQAEKDQVYLGADNVYYLKTNTKATVDYTSVKMVNGEVSGTPTSASAPIEDPKGKMNLDTSIMTVRKEFAHLINEEDPYEEIVFYLLVDGKYYNVDGTLSDTLDESKVYALSLPKNGKWEDQIYIAPGLMRGGDILETGHNYSLAEKIVSGNPYEYEFAPQTVRPMVITAVPTFLVMKDGFNTNADNKQEYTFNDNNSSYIVVNGKSDAAGTYYVASENNGSLTGVNHKTSELDITKIISDPQNLLTEAQEASETFTYRVTLQIPDGSDPSGIVGYEYVPRTQSNAFTLFGYQTGQSAFAEDIERFSGKTYRAWNTLVYDALIEYDRVTENGKTVIKARRDENGNIIWKIPASGDFHTITYDMTLKQDEVIRFTNLPTGTKYTIQEIYVNKYPADNAGGKTDGRAPVEDESNLSAEGYEIEKAQHTAGTLSADKTTVEGTIEAPDTRYYNQFTNKKATQNNTTRAELKVKKVVEDYTWGTEYYRFTLTAGTAQYNDADGGTGTSPMPDGTQNSAVSIYDSTADHTLSFGTIRYTRPGTYTYTIAEYDNSKNMPDVQFASPVTLTVTVTAGDDGKLTVTEIKDDKETTVFSSETSTAVASGLTTQTNTTKQIHIKKVDKNNTNTVLDGAVFEIHTGPAKMFLQAGKLLTADAVQEIIGMSVSAEGAAAAMQSNGIQSSFTLGEIRISGFAYDTVYELKEIAAPAGYVITNGSVFFKAVLENAQSYLRLTDQAGNILTGEISEIILDNDSASVSENTLSIFVKNEAGVELPQTGGEGTLIFSVLGTILILSSTLLILAKRKQEAYTPRH